MKANHIKHATYPDDPATAAQGGLIISDWNADHTVTIDNGDIVPAMLDQAGDYTIGSLTCGGADFTSQVNLTNYIHIDADDGGFNGGLWLESTATPNQGSYYIYQDTVYSLNQGWIHFTENKPIGFHNGSQVVAYIKNDGQIDSDTGFSVGGTQCLTGQMSHVADATGAGDIVAQFNALLAQLQAKKLMA